MAERDTRAMVSAGWWPGTPPQQRQNLVAGRMLALPDGSWWLFGAWGRWYRWTRADGQWHLCPPPQLSITRMSARPLQQGMPVPPVPPHVVPTGPDLAYDPPSPLAFVDAGVRPEVTSRVRATVESAAALPTPDYPHWWGLFSPSAPSTVPVTWGVMLWCATAPVFDSRLDAQLLGLWSSHRARPLPEIDGPRWLTPPPLESLIGLYAERLRTGRVDSAVVILRTMWAIASALREDVRFQPRADALIAMLGVTLQNPTVDYGALSYGDRAVVQQWLTRCPPALAPALRVEASAGEHFRNAYYDLATAVAPIAGEPTERGYVEPRLIAAALLAADLAVVRQDVSGQVIGWLDPQVGEVMRAMLIQNDHPLRPFWPEGDRMPRSLRERMDVAGPAVRNTLLATMYGADLAWCRLGGGIPARPRGFPSSVAILAEIIGPRRATSAASTEPAAPQAPGIAPLAHQYPANPSNPGRTPGVPMAQEPPTGPPGQAPAWASPSGSPPPPATEAWDGSTPLPTKGEREPGTPAAPPPTEAWSGPGSGGAGGPGSAPPATEAWLGAGSGSGGGHASPPPTEAWSGAEGLDAGGPKSPPPTQAWHGTGESASGAASSPPATQAWHGTGENAPGVPTSPPATQAWHGTRENAPGAASSPPTTQAWHRTGENAPGAPAPPPATQAWPGTGEREVGGAVPASPAAEAWSGSEGLDTARPKPPPATQAWPGTGEHEAGGAVSPPPATQSSPGTESGDTGGAGSQSPGSPGSWSPVGVARPDSGSGGDPGGGPGSEAPAEARSGTDGLDTDRPKPPPPTQAWPGTGERAVGVEPSAPSPPPATRAWPGTGSEDASSPPPGGMRPNSGTGSPGGADAESSADVEWPASEAGLSGGAGAESSAGAAWPGSEAGSTGGAGAESSAEARFGAEGLDEGEPESPSAQATPGTGEGGGAEASGPPAAQASYESGGNDPGEAEPSPSNSVARLGSEGLDPGGPKPHSSLGTGDRETGAPASDEARLGSDESGAGSPSSGAEASSADEDTDEPEGTATRPWTEAERLDALGAPPSGTDARPATGEQATADSAGPYAADERAPVDPAVPSAAGEQATGDSAVPSRTGEQAAADPAALSATDERASADSAVSSGAGQRATGDSGLPSGAGEWASGGSGLPSGTGEREATGSGLPSGAGEWASGGSGLPSGTGEREAAGSGLPSGTGGQASGGSGLPSGADGQAAADSAVPPAAGVRPGAEDSDAGEAVPPVVQAWSSAEGIGRDEAAPAARPSGQGAPRSAASAGTEGLEAGAGSSRPGESGAEAPLPSPTAQAWNGPSGPSGPAGPSGASGDSEGSGDGEGTPLVPGDDAATSEDADDRTVADVSGSATGHDVPSAGAFGDRPPSGPSGTSGGHDATPGHATPGHAIPGPSTSGPAIPGPGTSGPATSGHGASEHATSGQAAVGGFDDRTVADAGGSWSDRTMADVGGHPGGAWDDRTMADAVGPPGARHGANDANDAANPDANDDATGLGPADHDATSIDTDDDDSTAPDEHLNNATMLDPLDSSADQAKNATYVDWIGGTLADAGPIPLVAPAPVTPGPPRTRMVEEQDPAGQEKEPPERPGTRIMSGTMVSGLLGMAPMPEKPVEQIAPPKPAPMPKVAERFGIRFLSGIDDATGLFDELRRKATASPPVPPPALLIVGDPHTGQRRLTRLIARTLAGAGVGDGSVRTADGSELRGDHATTVTAILRGGGPPLLFERLDRAILDASDPDRVVAAVTRSRANSTVLIATATPDSYTRLAGRYPELARAFEVFRLPDLSGAGSRLALLHVLADERRVTINASGLDVVRGDLGRLAGHGDLVGARLVEAYLDRAVSRHTEREGAPRDRMVLRPVDFAGVAEDIEPVLRPPRDVDGFLRGLDEMIGLDEVKRTVGGLVAEARMAADRATRGLPSGNPSRHLIFLGRPGTGKATVAGLIGGIYAALNLLDSGHLVVCSARDFAGGDTGAKVAAHVDRAAGGVLLIEDAYLLDRMSAAVDELSRLMGERRDKFMVVCASLPDEMEGFLLANPGFRAEFGAIIEFREPTERQLVGLFSRLAERDLYMLDEELRVELLDCFAGMRRYPGFAFADTVRRLFDQIVARQASRLTGAHVNPAAVARLSIRDLPSTEGEQLLRELHPNRLRRPPE